LGSFPYYEASYGLHFVVCPSSIFLCLPLTDEWKTVKSLNFYGYQYVDYVEYTGIPLNCILEIIFSTVITVLHVCLSLYFVFLLFVICRVLKEEAAKSKIVVCFLV